MRSIRFVTALIIIAVLLEACGGAAAPTQQPAGATQTAGSGGTATDPPDATTNPGGGGGGGGGGGTLDTSHGKGHVDISGAATRNVDLGFQPLLSHFGGMDNTILYFVPASAEGALAVTVSTGGTFNAVYTSADLTVTGLECTATNLKVEATSASGTFDCAKNAVILASGASAENVGFKGSFEARG
jgi:hypothetical protein